MSCYTSDEDSSILMDHNIIASIYSDSLSIHVLTLIMSCLATLQSCLYITYKLATCTTHHKFIDWPITLTAKLQCRE